MQQRTLNTLLWRRVYNINSGLQYFEGALAQGKKCSPSRTQQFEKRHQEGSRAEITEGELPLSERSLCPPSARTRLR